MRAAQVAKTAAHPAHFATLPASAFRLASYAIFPAPHLAQSLGFPPPARNPPPSRLLRNHRPIRPPTYFDQHISAIVQGQCVACHVEGGASANTRIVFVAGTDAADRDSNRQTLRGLPRPRGGRRRAAPEQSPGSRPRRRHSAQGRLRRVRAHEHMAQPRRRGVCRPRRDPRNAVRLGADGVPRAHAAACRAALCRAQPHRGPNSTRSQPARCASGAPSAT